MSPLVNPLRKIYKASNKFTIKRPATCIEVPICSPHRFMQPAPQFIPRPVALIRPRSFQRVVFTPFLV